MTTSARFARPLRRRAGEEQQREVDAYRRAPQDDDAASRFEDDRGNVPFARFARR